ncbi:MAG: glycine--tRNA ligase [Nanoarchaeota archaeon]|nr:glycine--tRNA ligase [Nanoarchaeota archaeon]
MENKEVLSIEEMANFCKKKGFITRSAEIYGGFAGFWDYLFLGVELKKNIESSWWNFFVRGREDIVGIDGSIITSPQVWKSSGHVDSFSDVFVKCKKCKKASKIDKAELGKLKCENCGGSFDEENAKDFELMFKTNVGEKDFAYLRPETAQLIFTNFKSVFEGARMKLPCGIAQIGKSFRNEIAPRNFLFRSREFEQMEIEYFVKPKQKCPYEIPEIEVLVLSSEDQKGKRMKISEAFKKKIIKKDWHAYWLSQSLLWFKNLGCNLDNFRIRQHEKSELAHYSTDCWDLEYNFPFGWKELQGIADRGDYDLLQHEKNSRKDLRIFDEETRDKFLPHVICEPSFGVERSLLVFLYEAYFVGEKGNVVLKFNPKISPVKAAIFPLVKGKDYEELSKEVFDKLKKEFNVSYDKSGSIGRRYARNDEIGTPFCITIDEESLKNKDVTIRDRDTTKQVRIKFSDLKNILRELVDGEINFEDL